VLDGRSILRLKNRGEGDRGRGGNSEREWAGV